MSVVSAPAVVAAHGERRPRLLPLAIVRSAAGAAHWLRRLQAEAALPAAPGECERLAAIVAVTRQQAVAGLSRAIVSLGEHDRRALLAARRRLLGGRRWRALRCLGRPQRHLRALLAEHLRAVRRLQRAMHQAAGEHRAALERGGDILFASAAADRTFRAGLVFGSFWLQELLEKGSCAELPPRKRRNALAGLYKFLCRYSTKVSPLGLFAEVALASLTGATPVGAGHPGERRVISRVDRWALLQLRNRIEADDEYRQTAPLLVNGAVRVDSGVAHALWDCWGRTEVRSFACDDTYAVALRILADREEWEPSDLTSRLAGALGCSPPEAAVLVAELEKAGVLRRKPPFNLLGSGDIEDQLAAAVPPAYRSTVEAMRRLRAFGEELEERSAEVRAAERQLAAVLTTGQPVGAALTLRSDVFRNGSHGFEVDLAQRVAEVGVATARGLAVFSNQVELYLQMREFFQHTFRRSPAVDFLRFFIGFSRWWNERRDPGSREVDRLLAMRGRWLDDMAALYECCHREAGSDLHLPVAAVSDLGLPLAEELAPPLELGLSGTAFYQRAGNHGLAVVNQLWPGGGRAFSRFLHGLSPALTATLRRWNREAVDGHLVELAGTAIHSSNVHECLTDLQIVMPLSAERLDGAEPLAIADLCVTLQPDGNIALQRRQGGRRVFPVDLGFLSPRNQSRLSWALQAFSPFLHVGLEPLKHFLCDRARRGTRPSGEMAAIPRTIVGDQVVIQRRAWIDDALATAAGADIDHGFFRRLRRALEVAGAPPSIFVSRPAGLGLDGAPLKPLFVDATVPLGVEVLRRELERSPGPVLVEEVLPAIDDASPPQELVIQWYA